MTNTKQIKLFKKLQKKAKKLKKTHFYYCIYKGKLNKSVYRGDEFDVANMKIGNFFKKKPTEEQEKKIRIKLEVYKKELESINFK